MTLKENQIKNHLQHVFDTWVSSFNDPSTEAMIRDNCFISGGAIVSLLNGEEPNDYDLYFTNKGVAKKVLQKYIGDFNKYYGDGHRLGFDKNHCLVNLSHPYTPVSEPVDYPGKTTNPSGGLTMMDSSITPINGKEEEEWFPILSFKDSQNTNGIEFLIENEETHEFKLCGNSLKFKPKIIPEDPSKKKTEIVPILFTRMQLLLVIKSNVF